MPINQTELLSVARQIAEDDNINITLRESAKGGLIACAGAFLGGLIGGPIGLACGGTAGSIYAAYAGSGKYKSVAAVIMEDMTPTQQTQLANSLRRALENVQVEDVVSLTALLVANASLKQLLITEMCNFLRTEMGLAISL